MSADNGIYILETFGPEYRVKECQAIDSIYGKYDDETFQWEGDNELIKEYFVEAPVFSTLEEALDKAQEMSYDVSYLEDGICVISDFKNRVFNDL
jgi:hypothetical protein